MQTVECAVHITSLLRHTSKSFELMQGLLMLQFLTFCLIQHLASICKPILSFINRHLIACVCTIYSFYLYPYPTILQRRNNIIISFRKYLLVLHFVFSLYIVHQFHFFILCIFSDKEAVDREKEKRKNKQLLGSAQVHIAG